MVTVRDNFKFLVATILFDIIWHSDGDRYVLFYCLLFFKYHEKLQAKPVEKKYLNIFFLRHTIHENLKTNEEM